MPRDGVPAGRTNPAAARAVAPSSDSATAGAPQVSDPLKRFVLFLENFAPLVNSLNLGIANPLLLGPSPLHFAQIKTQLALQQLNAVASHGSTPPYTLLNQAFLKIAMSRPRFNPRGDFPLQRPRAPNPSGMRPPGPFMRPGSMGLPRFYPAGRARGIPHRFAGHESYQNMGPQRMNVQVTQHRTDPRLTKEKLDFHEAQQKKGKPHGSRWDDEPHISASVAVKQSSITQVTEQSPKVQSRYTKESASSILASFGLSNEDLEELSRYPDEQLTPENMPLILRDIRMRKMGRRLPNLPSQSRNKETLGSEAVSSNVIDYGHASKYGYTEDPLEVRIYDPEIPTDEVENEFQSQQSISASVPNPNVICNSMFPVEDVFHQMDFPGESSNNRSFFPVESGTKMSGLHISGGQSVLEPIKSVNPSINQTVSQTMNQSLIPPSMNQQPFSSELISTVSQQERIPHEPVINSSNVHVGSRGSKKNYQSQTDIPIRSPFGIVKASWLPKFSHADAQKMKRLPTPSMMNDYYAASPRIFPHLCSLCNVECSHLKDWIQHQNTSTHIESCRQLRQQYPDWNPEILPSRRNEGNRKENETPRRRSHSPSPRRSRRSSSSHRIRRSRSPMRYMYRPRSRSPRICHRFISRYRSRSRSRSRSPYRIKNPFRGSPKCFRSASPERISRRSVRSSDRKKALEDVVQQPGHGTEFNKQKHLEAIDKGHSPAQKPKTGSGTKPSVKSTSTSKSDSNLGGHSVRCKSKNLEDDTSPECKPVSDKAVSLQRKLRKEQSLHCGSVLLISELPEDGCTEEDVRKLFQPFGKVNDVLIVPYRKEAYLEMEFKEAITAIMKHIETTPLMIKGKNVKVCVPGKKKAQNKEVKKKALESKKVSASTLKRDTDASKAVEIVTSASAAKTGQTKASVAKVNKSAGKSASSVKSVVTVAAKGNKASIKTAKSGGKKSLEAKKTGNVKNKDSNKPATVPENSEVKTSMEAKATENCAKEVVSEAALETTENEPVSKETEEMCVMLISNLPNKGYSTEEVCDLAKPFGGLKDVLIFSSHKKAYIEINRKAAESMVKFYTCFPVLMDGNQLSISMAPENMNVKDEEAIFTTLVKENDPEANIDTIYDRFVHLDNLPEDGLQCVLCVGLQFGKVDHHVFISNKNKAILQLDSPESAQSMYSFLKQNPQNIGDHILTCTLSPKIDLPEVQTEQDPELEEESPGLKNNPVDESEVQTATDSPSVKPNELEEESTPNMQTEILVQQEEPCEEEPEKATCDSNFAIETLEVETQGEEVKEEIALVASTPASIELFTENAEECALNQQVYNSDLEKKDAGIINPETALLPSDGVFIEERNIKGVIEESPSEAEDFFSGVTQSVVEAIAEVEKRETVSEILPSACIVPLVPGVSTGDEKTVGKKSISEKKSNMDEKEENEFNTKETRMDLQIGIEKAEKNEGRMVAEKVEKILASVKEKPAENTLFKAYPNKGVGQANNPDETSKTSILAVSNVSSNKSSIKAVVVSSPKAKATASKTENQKSFLKSALRDQINAEKKLSAKEFALLKPTSARSGLAENSSKLKPTQSSFTRGGSGKISALQGKLSKLDYRDITKQSQETEARPSIMKRDDSNNKTLAGQNTKNSKSAAGRSSKSKEEPLFPFNLDEFVTVDEVIEEVNPSQAKQNPLKGKKKEALRNVPFSELNLKKKKGKTSAPRGVEGELSFVTLDEIGEEEDAAAHLAQALVTVDEVIDEEELNMEEMVKNSNSLFTLDELIDQDDCISHSEPKDVTVLSVAEEQDLLKQERLVTVDEIGEVEELPLNESADITFATLNTKGNEGDTVRDSIGFISSQMPEDPSTLVTVDEIQDDSSDLHLVTLDEVTEEDEDSLADFNNLKEELNFVTVDEVGEEEDGDNDLKVELAQSKNDGPTDKKGNRKKRAVDTKKTKLEALSQVAPVNENVTEEDLKTMIERHVTAKTPTKRVRIGKTLPSEKAVVTEPAKGEEAFQMSEVDEESELKDSEPERKRKKTEDSSLGKSVASDVPEELDFLVPKAGFFCPICSLFYSGEKAMTNHCKSTRHKQNTEKFMAKQRKEKEQNEAEERSSR
ncbi:zinc finger protein 638 isoform X1 [Cebus imitator]|uniref:Zinc finger protein 638 n=2 Tax=Cebus imitator TaxID=2715852 RepID=A0A2K5QXV2_CEBIM|nr:zinc finger protein 638 isoform X1 [Cebus imitator]